MCEYRFSVCRADASQSELFWAAQWSGVSWCNLHLHKIFCHDRPHAVLRWLRSLSAASNVLLPIPLLTGRFPLPVWLWWAAHVPTSFNDLLLCSATYGFPFRGSSASSPSFRYRFTHAATRLFLTPYMRSISMSEICYSKCRRIYPTFSSLVYFRCGVPFFPFSFPPLSSILPCKK